jgi:ADP-ribose pyrophosphatase
MKNTIAYRKLVHTGRVCRLYTVGLQTPEGKIIERDLIEYSGAVVVVPVLADGSVVVIRNERFAVGEELCEFCAGMIDPGEAPEAAAGRELIEETGYSAGKLVSLGWFYTGPGSTTEVMHAFLATELKPVGQDLEEYENIRTELVSLERLEEMIATGALHDGKSISAWALWRLRERQA